ncbi:exodeoxyribonuclease VII large subunit [Patescibacteria group bacterium]|nr:exodeoxyribonuclease VII large subunit [Patescibacteria group bacterium]
MESGSAEKIFRVGEYIELLNVFLEREEVKITGEVSELKRAASGHVYFSIKDGDGESVLNAIIWSRNYDLCGVKLEIGMEVVLAGHPHIYPQRGTLSFIADTVELVGEGALKRAYDELKNRLEKEGVFDVARKRPIPKFAQRIGVITSREGAVIHDFENNLGKFGFKILFVDSRVEGQAAVKDLLAAIKTMRNQDIEVLVMIRGGGSLESLQAFNNENLVREITNFPVPVIAGIGHDKDVPLLALAADQMVSTPTAAANLLNQSWEEAYTMIHQLTYILSSIGEKIESIRNEMDAAWNSAVERTSQTIKILKERLDLYARSAKLNDPTRQLQLGYSITRHDGKIVHSERGIGIGDVLDTELSDGTIISKVTKK